MDTDRNLLFGVLALQADLIGPDRFAEACAAWAVRKATPLADLLPELVLAAGVQPSLIECLLVYPDLVVIERSGKEQS